MPWLGSLSCSCAMHSSRVMLRHMPVAIVSFVVQSRNVIMQVFASLLRQIGGFALIPFLLIRRLFVGVVGMDGSLDVSPIICVRPGEIYLLRPIRDPLWTVV